MAYLHYLLSALGWLDRVRLTRAREVAGEIVALGVGGIDLHGNSTYTLLTIPGKEFSGPHLVFPPVCLPQGPWTPPSILGSISTSPASRRSGCCTSTRGIVTHRAVAASSPPTGLVPRARTRSSARRSSSATPSGGVRGGTIAPPVVVQSSPTTYIQQEPAAPAYWYYCQNPQGYYPYVTQCLGGWLTVIPPAQ